jgi:hypothetical protein
MLHQWLQRAKWPGIAGIAAAAAAPAHREPDGATGQSNCACSEPRPLVAFELGGRMRRREMPGVGYEKKARGMIAGAKQIAQVCNR